MIKVDCKTVTNVDFAPAIKGTYTMAQASPVLVPDLILKRLCEPEQPGSRLYGICLVPCSVCMRPTQINAVCMSMAAHMDSVSLRGFHSD